ncbi:hypothetical protein ABZ235_13025 [Streptomyces canus]|uniref:hypothetical protein n=1 Tax=Streptomyces canus TaxID=58343 RepID=UPI0033ABC4B5
MAATRSAHSVPRCANAIRQARKYLSSRHGHAADRPRILEALFARDDRSTRAYLRQAVRQLNLALPPQLRLIVEQNRLSLADELARGCQSLVMEADLAHTYRLAGRARLSAIEALLARNEGDYLPDRTAQWVAERRRELSRPTSDALSSAAELALQLHQYGDAVRLCQQATAIDPSREVAWRHPQAAQAAAAVVQRHAGVRLHA